MYTNVSLEMAMAKRRDLMAQAAKDRLGRQARHLVPASEPAASRRSRRNRQLMHLLRPQAQP
jgi:hypothetical protein